MGIIEIQLLFNHIVLTSCWQLGFRGFFRIYVLCSPGWPLSLFVYLRMISNPWSLCFRLWELKLRSWTTRPRLTLFGTCLVLVVNLTQSRLTWEEGLSERLASSGWPVSMAVGSRDYLDCLNKARRPAHLCNSILFPEFESWIKCRGEIKHR